MLACSFFELIYARVSAMDLLKQRGESSEEIHKAKLRAVPAPETIEQFLVKS